MQSLFDAVENCLLTCEIEDKLCLTQHIAEAWRNGQLSLQTRKKPKPIGQPGRPAKPVLVMPGNVPKRRLGTKTGFIALIHAVTHIEFNAINLAWDAVYRFRDMPQQYYSDWVQVAIEEAHHFQLLRQRLRDFDCDYGDLPAYNGLWNMAVHTAFDPMVRMALVPRVLEARGLDVTPSIIKRLQQAGDEKTAAILEIILRDEIGHVKIGSYWYKYCCNQRGLDSEKTFHELIKQHFSGQICGPFSYEARREAGFTTTELAALDSLPPARPHAGNTVL